MPRLTNPDLFELSETAKLRQRREELLGVAHRRRHRLHRLPRLTGELQQATTELLKQELAEQKPPQPLGDAGAIGEASQRRLPYKD